MNDLDSLWTSRRLHMEEGGKSVDTKRDPYAVIAAVICVCAVAGVAAVLYVVKHWS